MDDSATNSIAKRLAVGVLGSAAAFGVFYVAADLDTNSALGTVVGRAIILFFRNFLSCWKYRTW
jgi:putative flippase GtrA